VFESLGSRLQTVFDGLTRRGKLTEADVDRAMREVRLALLEADVNFKVVKNFVGRVRERAVGHEVMRSLTNWRFFCGVRDDALYWWPLMFTDRPRLTNCRRWDANLMFRYTVKAQRPVQ
jgi:signal recognition particle GTPase